MNREEAITALGDRNNLLWGMSKEEQEYYSKALDMAISTLSENKTFEGMTNGDVIISLYPNLKYTIQNGRVVTTIGVASSFDLEWWNAPYKAESEGKE